MDPGTALGVASLGLEICKGLLDYYLAFKDFRDDFRETYGTIFNLALTFDLLHKALSTDPENAQAAQVTRCLEACEDGIARLKRKLDKLHKVDLLGPGQKATDGGLRLLYPFRKSTLEQIKEIVRGLLMQHLELAIDVLLVSTTSETLARVALVESSAIEIEESASRIEKCSPSTTTTGVQSPLAASTTMRTAWNKHEPGIGEWPLTPEYYEQ